MGTAMGTPTLPLPLFSRLLLRLLLGWLPPPLLPLLLRAGEGSDTGETQRHGGKGDKDQPFSTSTGGAGAGTEIRDQRRGLWSSLLADAVANGLRRIS